MPALPASAFALLRSLVLCLICLAFIGPVPAALAQDGETPEIEADMTAADEVAVDPSAQDAQIEERIRAILDATRRYGDVDVRVDQGVAFLDGEVADAAASEWVAALTKRTEGVVAVVNALSIAAQPLWSIDPAIGELQKLGREATAAAPLVVLALVILPLAWFAAKLTLRVARRLLSRSDGSPFLKDLMARAIALPVFLLGLYIVLQVAGLTQLALSVIGGAGVIGIVVGFAFRDIAENFLASLLLSIRQPFRRGDFIDVAGESGSVQSMDTRSTLLLSLEGNHIQIPNSVIFKSTITNYTSYAARRETLSVGVGYDAVIADAQTIISSILRDHPAVSDDPAPFVLVDELGGSTVNLKAYFWFDGHRHSPLKLRSALYRQMKAALMEEGVSMPDDAREVIFPQGVPVIQSPTEPPAPRPEERRRGAASDAAASNAAENELESDLPSNPKGATSPSVKEHASGDLLTS